MIDRATDAWRAQRFFVGRTARVITNVAVSIAYLVAYLGLRAASNDQWYLPAGLRFAALLVTPYRLWPALFVGDVAAIASYRVNMIPHYGLIYYFASSVAAWPVVAVIVRQLRRRTALPRLATATDAVALIVAAVLSAELVGLVNKAASAYLRPGGVMAYGDLIVYSLGHVQGILLASFGLVLGYSRWQDLPALRLLGIESMCTAVLCGLLAIAASTMSAGEPSALMALRLCLLVPVVTLAFRHGWRGAALGGIIADVALFATIPHQEAGQADGAALLMQEAFVFVSAALFLLGTRGHQRSKVFTNPAELEREARTRAREQYVLHERQLRAHAVRAEAVQRDARGDLAPVIHMLRERGQSEIAMSLIGMTHTQSSQFERTVVDSIYPLTLERLGLFFAVESEAFAQHFGSAEPSFDLTGSPHVLTLETALAAYRVLGEAIEHVALSHPERISVRIHCSTAYGPNVVKIAVYAIGPSVTGRSALGTARLAQLRNHVAAYGGSLHNRSGKIRFFLVDDVAYVPKSRACRSKGRASPCLAD